MFPAVVIDSAHVSSLRELFRAFKRRASLIRDAVAEFGDDEKLELKMSLRAGRVPSTSFDESTSLARFAALLRPFMDANSHLEVSAVWSSLLDSGLTDDDTRQACSVAFNQAEALDFPVRLNARDLTTRDVYFAYGEGELFNSDPEAMKLLRQLTSFVGPQLLQFLFYGACLNFVNAVFAVLEAILRAERAHPEVSAPVIDAEQCIYCLTREGDFSAEEHVIPEAFGLDDLRLYGCVCNRCNNELSKLDQFLAEFEPLALLRVQNVPLTKKGKFPHADFRDFKIAKTKPRVLTVTSKTGKEIFRRQDLPDGSLRLTNTLTGKRPLDAIRLARAVFKISLGLIAFDHGADYACSPRFDAARAFIRGDGVMPNHLVMPTKGDPHGEIRTEWLPLEDATPVHIDVFGVRFGLNLEPSPFFIPSDAQELPLVAFWLGELTKRGIVVPCRSGCEHSASLPQDPEALLT